jgi:hypothetical protein
MGIVRRMARNASMNNRHFWKASRSSLVTKPFDSYRARKWPLGVRRFVLEADKTIDLSFSCGGDVTFGPHVDFFHPRKLI